MSNLNSIYYLIRCLVLNFINISGDAIYGTGLVAALLSLIIALVKLHVKGNSAQIRSHVPKPNDYSTPTRSNHSTAAQNSNVPPSISFAPTNFAQTSSIQPIRDLLTLISDSHRVDSRNANASAPLETIFHSASSTQLSSAQVQPSLAAQSSVRQVNEVASYRNIAFCSWKVGKCISGNCKCHKARKACTPLCHGGKDNINCKATIDRVYE